MGCLLWEVVGGSKSGGIQVRGGRSLTSTLFECRLSTGALVLQRARVSIASHGRTLLAPVDSRVPDEEHAVVACVGDSITGGGCVPPSGAYPTLLQRLLRSAPPPEGCSGWAVENYGVGATSATRAPPHTPYVRTQTFRDAVRSGADAFVVCFGTNDALKDTWSEEGYVRGLCRIVEALSAVRPCLVFVMTPPPVYNRSGISALRSLPVVNGELPLRVLPRLAEELGAQLIDAFGALGGQELLGGRFMLWDGVHPDVEGNEVIAQLVCNALASAASDGRLQAVRSRRSVSAAPCQALQDQDAEADTEAALEGEDCGESAQEAGLADADQGVKGPAE
eukprot:CAMPEP_0175330132 /NCGR_PEP_ID=MMETSP0095-20121207/564_1 /TAXON_ID=311494 /ORGANISM="Alexandrium monilatum, Strain CCMP3105" /LENGTH=335 /DNA_ID=CAMNT_0016627299 /DNA_START=23 /DNA_END=1027 /DNA_ORIENTATION=+